MWKKQTERHTFCILPFHIKKNTFFTRSCMYKILQFYRILNYRFVKNNSFRYLRRINYSTTIISFICVILQCHLFMQLKSLPKTKERNQYSKKHYLKLLVYARTSAVLCKITQRTRQQNKYRCAPFPSQNRLTIKLKDGARIHFVHSQMTCIHHPDERRTLRGFVRVFPKLYEPIA